MIPINSNIIKSTQIKYRHLTPVSRHRWLLLWPYPPTVTLVSYLMTPLIDWLNLNKKLVDSDNQLYNWLKFFQSCWSSNSSWNRSFLFMSGMPAINYGVDSTAQWATKLNFRLIKFAHQGFNHRLQPKTPYFWLSTCLGKSLLKNQD